jgi:hypothetical protein
MKISVLAVASLAVLTPATRAMAQNQAAAYPQQKKSFRFAKNTLARYE